MSTAITCRDTDDPDCWAERLNASDERTAGELINQMWNLAWRLSGKGIPAPHVTERVKEGEAIYEQRFGARLPF